MPGTFLEPGSRIWSPNSPEAVQASRYTVKSVDLSPALRRTPSNAPARSSAFSVALSGTVAVANQQISRFPLKVSPKKSVDSLG